MKRTILLLMMLTATACMGAWPDTAETPPNRFWWGVAVTTTTVAATTTAAATTTVAATTTTTTTGWSYPELDSIVLRYVGNVTASTNAQDEAGGDFDGVPYPTPSSGPVAASGYYTLDGSDDYYLVDGSSFAALNGKSNVTWAAWIRPLVSGTSYGRILDRTWNGQFSFYFNDVKAIGFALKPTGGGVDTTLLTGTGSVTTGAWHHAVVTYDGETLLGYVDGAVKGTNATPSGALVNYAGDMTIGDRTDGTDRKYEGRITELIVWTNKLSAAQISDLYSNGPQPQL